MNSKPGIPVLILLFVATTFCAPSPGSSGAISINGENDLIKNLEDALGSNKTAVVRFYADWCPVCQADAPEFAKVVDKHVPEDSTKFLRVDVQENPQLTVTYGVRAVPTYFVLRRNMPQVTYHGAQDVDHYLQQQRSGRSG